MLLNIFKKGLIIFQRQVFFYFIHVCKDFLIATPEMNVTNLNDTDDYDFYTFMLQLSSQLYHTGCTDNNLSV